MPASAKPAEHDPFYMLLGIAPDIQPADHYHLLGIERLEFNADVISNAAQRQCDHLNRHTTGEFASVVELLVKTVLMARDCLLDHDSHLRYAAELQGFDVSPTDPAAQADLRSFSNQFDRAWISAQSDELDPLHLWLGIPLAQRPASNFRLLGVSAGERHPTAIQNSAERQIAFVRKFAIGAHSEDANELLRQLGRARSALMRNAGSVVAITEQPRRIETRIDPPEPIAVSVPKTTVYPRTPTTPSRSSIRGRRRPKRRTSAIMTVVAWITPFVVPSAAIFAYVKLSGNDDRQLAGLRETLNRSLQDRTEREPSPKENVSSDDGTLKSQQDHQRRLPPQTHSKPDSVYPETREQKPTAETASEHQPLDLVPASSPEPSIQDVSKVEEKPSGEQQFFRDPRDWSLKRGRTFGATVVELGRDHVTMRNAVNGREAKLALESFIDEDQRILRTTYLNSQDKAQLLSVQGFVLHTPSPSKDSAETLSRSHAKYADSPYAGLWQAMKLCERDKQISAALVMLAKVIDRIEYQRKIDPNRHSMTLASALNNRAICMIMEHKASAAAGLLSQSLDVLPAPSSPVLHNSRYLLTHASQKNNALKLNSTTKRKLTQSLQGQPTDPSGLRENWYYSLDVDLPNLVDESQDGAIKYFSQQSGVGQKLVVRNTVCVSCKGEGYYDCRNCNKGFISVTKQVSMGINPLTNKPDFAPKVFRERCRSCDGKGTLDCGYCDAGRLP